MRIRRATLTVLVLSALAVFLVPRVWAYPPAGTDTFSSTAEVTVDLSFSGGPVIPLTLSGPTTVLRSNPFLLPDGVTMAIDTSISLSLIGGGATVVTAPSPPSTGQIQQITAGTDFPASSFFDVFVDITLPPNPTVHNETPVVMTATPDLTAIPPTPGTTYVASLTCIPIFTAAGVQVGCISHVRHVVGGGGVPEFGLSTTLVIALSLLVLTALPKRRKLVSLRARAT